MVSDSSQNDFQVIKRVLNGSTHSYSALVEKYQPRLQIFCAQMLSSKEAGRDASQETFIKAFQSLKTFRADSSFAAWLFQIGRNHCIDLLRKNKRRPQSEYDEDRGYHHSNKTNFDSKIEAKDLTAKILRLLPEKYRELILLKESQDLTYEEIAKITSSSLESVKGRLKRARIEVIKIMKDFELKDNI